MGRRVEPDIQCKDRQPDANVVADIADRRDRNRPAGSGPALQAEVDREQRLINEAIRADSLKRWTDREFTTNRMSLLEADRIALVAALAAGVAHETNNPLTATLEGATYAPGMEDMQGGGDDSLFSPVERIFVFQLYEIPWFELVDVTDLSVDQTFYHAGQGNGVNLAGRRPV